MCGANHTSAAACFLHTQHKRHSSVVLCSSSPPPLPRLCPLIAAPRRESEEAKAAAAPVQGSSVRAPLIGDAASSELAQRLKQRAQKLSQEEEQQS